MAVRQAKYTLQENVFIEIAANNPSRQFLSISNMGNNDVLVNFASVANSTLDGGIIIPPLYKSNAWQMPTNAIYTGVISATSLYGEIDILILEY